MNDDDELTDDWRETDVFRVVHRWTCIVMGALLMVAAVIAAYRFGPGITTYIFALFGLALFVSGVAKGKR